MSQPRSKTLFSNLPLTHQNIVRDYFLSLGEPELKESVESFLIEETNSVLTDNKTENEDIIAAQQKAISSNTKRLEEFAQEGRILLKSIEYRAYNRWSLVTKPDNKSHWQLLHEELKNFDLLEALTKLLGLREYASYYSNKELLTENQLLQKLNLISPSSLNIIFQMCALAPIQKQEQFFESLIKNERYDLDFSVVIMLFIQNGMRINVNSNVLITKLISEILDLNARPNPFKLGIINAMLNNPHVISCLNNMIRDETSNDALVKFCRSIDIYFERLAYFLEENEEKQEDQEFLILNLIKDLTRKFDIKLLKNLSIQNLLENACKYNHRNLLFLLNGYCMKDSQLKKIASWAFKNLDTELLTHCIEKYRYKQEITLRVIEPNALIQLLQSKDKRAQELLNIILQKFNVVPIHQSSIIIKLIKNSLNKDSEILTPDEFYDCLYDAIRMGDDTLTETLIALDEARMFSSVRWLDSTNGSSTLLQKLLDSSVTQKGAKYILEYRNRNPIENQVKPLDYVEEKETKSNLDHFLKKYEARSLEELIDKIPEIGVDQDAIKCILCNSLGYEKREELISNRFLKKDAHGRILLHYLIALPEEDKYLVELLLNCIRPDRIAARSVLVEDKEGMSPLHLAAQTGSKHKIELLRGNFSRPLEFNLEQHPTPIDLIYKSDDLFKIQQCMDALVPNSASAKDYFFRKYGPKVETLTPQDHEKLAQEWFPFRFGLDRIVKLDFFLQKPDDKKSQLEALKHADEIASILRGEKLAAFLPVYRQINFNLLEEKHIPVPEAKLDSNSRNIFMRAKHLTTKFRSEDYLAALDDFAGLKSTYPQSVENEINVLHSCISIYFVRPLIENIFHHREMKMLVQNERIMSRPLTMKEIAQKLGLQNETTVSEIFKIFSRSVPQCSEFFQRALENYQGNLVKLLIENNAFLPLPHPQHPTYFETTRNLFTLIIRHARPDIIDALLDRTDNHFVDVMKSFGDLNLNEEVRTPLHDMINFLCRNKFYPQLIKLLNKFTPPEIRNTKLVAAFEDAFKNNNRELLHALSRVHLPGKSIIKGLIWAVENNDFALFKELLNNATRNHIDLCTNENGISHLIATLFKTKPHHQDFLKELDRRHILPSQFTHISIVISNKAYGLPTPITEVDFFKILKDLFITIKFSKTPTVESAAIETLLALDAAGALGAHHFNSWRGTYFLKSSIENDNKIVLRAILNYREKFSLPKSRDNEEHLEVKQSVKENAPTSKLFPEIFFKKYAVTSIEQLIEKMPEISKDVEAVISIIFNTCGYHDREMLLKMQLAKQDHAGRTPIHYLASAATTDARSAISTLLNVIMPESRINGFVEVEDQKNMSAVHLAAQKGDLMTLVALYGNGQRPLNFDPKKSSNPIQLAYECKDENAALPCVLYLINHSRSGKEYLFNQFGPEVSAQEYKTKSEEWLTELNSNLTDDLIRLDRNTYLTADPKAQHEALLTAVKILENKSAHAFPENMRADIFLKTLQRLHSTTAVSSLNKDDFAHLIKVRQEGSHVPTQGKELFYRGRFFQFVQSAQALCLAMNNFGKLREYDTNTAKQELLRLDNEFKSFENLTTREKFQYTSTYILNMTKILRNEFTKSSMFREISEKGAIKYWDPIIKTIRELMESQINPQEKLLSLKKLIEHEKTPPILKDTLRQTQVGRDINLPRPG